MTTKHRRQPVAGEVDAIRAEYAEQEAEATEPEVAERNAALDVALSLRIDRELDTQLRQRAAAAQIPVPSLVRRLFREAIAPSGLAATDRRADRPTCPDRSKLKLSARHGSVLTESLTKHPGRGSTRWTSRHFWYALTQVDGMPDIQRDVWDGAIAGS